MSKVASFNLLIAEDMQALDRLIRQKLDSNVELINSVAHDIIAGGGLGLLSSFLSYTSYYHNPLSKRAGCSRVAGEERRNSDGADTLL